MGRIVGKTCRLISGGKIMSVLGGWVLVMLILVQAALAQSELTPIQREGPGKAKEGSISNTNPVVEFGNIPAFFTENQGQTAKEVKYYFKGNDNVYFTDNGVMFQKIETQKRETGIEDSNVGAGLPRPHRDGDAEAVEAKTLAYKLEFIGSKPTSPQPRNELRGKVNYFIGSDPSKWHTNIPTYQEIVYPGLYPPSLVQSSSPSLSLVQSLIKPVPDRFRNQGLSIEPNVSVQAASLNQQESGIDLVYKGVPGGMKYEFIVQPGADPDVIRLAYTGIEGLSIDDSGNLIIHTALGDVKDAKPYCYQEIDGKQVEVKCNFVIMEYSNRVAVDTHPQPLLLEGSTGTFPLYQEGTKGCVTCHCDPPLHAMATCRGRRSNLIFFIQ